MSGILFAALAAALADTAPKTPTVPLDAQVDYYRSDASVNRLTLAGQAANAELQQSIAALVAACGDKHHPDAQGKRIVCVPNPDSPKK